MKSLLFIHLAIHNIEHLPNGIKLLPIIFKIILSTNQALKELQMPLIFFAKVSNLVTLNRTLPFSLSQINKYLYAVVQDEKHFTYLPS